MLKSKFGGSHLIDTIHKFQGKERKNIILSTLSNKVDLTREEEPDFLNNPNLLNVAISRAQNKLFVVISEELMNQNGAILSDFARYTKYYTENRKIEKSKVYSVMDLMYSTYSPVLEKFKAKLKKVSNYESENIVNAIIEEICEEGKFGVLGFHINYALRYVVNPEFIENEEEKKFASNVNTHLDFLIFNKMDKSIRLVIEVDGMQHHTEVQKSRDEKKDKILKNAGIKILRISTTSSKVKERIEEALKI